MGDTHLYSYSVCNCIKSESGGANPALADEIEEEYSASPANNSEELRHRSSSPVNTSSSKGIVKQFVAKLHLLFRSYTPTAETTFPSSPLSPVVYVKKKCEKYDVPDNLNWMIEDLQQDFITNMRESKNSFCSHDVAKVTDYVQDYTATLLSPRFCKHQTIELIQEKFEGIKTMTQLFRALHAEVHLVVHF